jgi:hypothetical protein
MEAHIPYLQRHGGRAQSISLNWTVRASFIILRHSNCAGSRSIGLFVHHTDAERECAYDRQSHVGTLDKVLDMAKKNDWIVVDMKRDWKQVFAWE